MMSEVASKKRRAISMDKALAVLPRLEQELERIYRHSREAGLTQDQHLHNKRGYQANLKDANLPGWAVQQLSGYDRALYRQQERDTVFVYRCPDTGKYYTTHADTCPGLEGYPMDKLHGLDAWRNGSVWRHSKLPFFGDICV